MTQQADDFFGNAPSNYEVPKSEGRYMRFKVPGNYKFRILQKPIFGFEGWKVVDGKDTPVRFPMDQKPTDLTPFKRSEVNHFWAMPVYNFNTEQVEVLQINQKGIQGAIESYARNEDWGSPLNYNLTVTREGTGLEDTRYTTVASPHSPLPGAANAQWNEVQKEGFNIAELYTGGEPFKPTTPAPIATPAAAPAPEVAAEPEVAEEVDTATPPN
jgi:hypothetical protein